MSAETYTCDACGKKHRAAWPDRALAPHPFWRSSKLQVVCSECDNDLRSMTNAVERIILRRGRKRVFNLVGRFEP